MMATPPTTSPCLVVTRRVVAIEETITTGLRDDVGAILGDDAFAGERLEVELSSPVSFKQGKRSKAYLPSTISRFTPEMRSIARFQVV